MRLPLLVPGLIAACLLLGGCSAAAPAPVPTVTVTAAAPVPSLAPGDSAVWDLSAVCAVQSEIRTLAGWREQQVQAGRLTAAQSTAVLQAIAVQHQRLTTSGVPDSVRDDLTVLAGAAGTLTLERPRIDLGSAAVQRAQQHVADVCQAHGLTIGILAQGG